MSENLSNARDHVVCGDCRNYHSGVCLAHLIDVPVNRSVCVFFDCRLGADIPSPQIDHSYARRLTGMMRVNGSGLNHISLFLPVATQG